MSSSEQRSQLGQESGGSASPLWGLQTALLPSHSPLLSPGPQKELGWVLRKALSEKVQALPTQLREGVPAGWEAFAGGLMGIITRFHVLPHPVSILTH